MDSTYILDTNVFLKDPFCMAGFAGKIVLPLKVIEELDTKKNRMDKIGFNARQSIRNITLVRDSIFYSPAYKALLPESFDKGNSDNQIISVALKLKQDSPERRIILVTNDFNMSIRCSALGIETQEFALSEEEKTQLPEQLYTGRVNLVVDDDFIDDVYSADDVFLFEEDFVDRELYKNQFIVFESCQNKKRKAYVRFIEWNKPVRKIKDLNPEAWNIKALNVEQAMALDVLLDPSVPVVSLVGIAGSGKTLCALASGLQQIFSRGKKTKRYRKLLVSRPIQTMGNDIGFLPGSIEDKMKPWMGPIYDNLETLSGGKSDRVEGWFDSDKISVEALTYIRGRSITDAFIILDEAQNLDAHEIKTILTRVGRGTKIVLTGDVEQIDNAKLNRYHNGLSYVIEKLKHHGLMAHVTLNKGERSEVAALAARVL